jgi:hypothetical protein
MKKVKKERKFDSIHFTEGFDAFAVDREKYGLHEAVMMLYEQEPEEAMRSWRLVKSWVTSDLRSDQDGKHHFYTQHWKKVPRAFPVWLFIFDKDVIDDIGKNYYKGIYFEEVPGHD